MEIIYITDQDLFLLKIIIIIIIIINNNNIIIIIIIINIININIIATSLNDVEKK